MGGAIFVMQGANLTIAGTLTVNGGTVTGGVAPSGGNGQAFGSGLFMQGSGTITFQPGAGQNQTISDTIADEAGVVAGGYTPPTGFTPGAWGIVKNGAGTLTLAGTNSYSGGTTIAAGTLQLGNGGTTGSVLGNVLNNGTLAFNRSNDYQFDGAISGTGAVQQSGAGTRSPPNLPPARPR